MKYFFEEHKGESLVMKSVGYYSFIIEKGIADVLDEPPVDPALSGPARQRADHQRQARIEARAAAARELGGLPYTETRAKTRVKIDEGGVSDGS